MESIFLNLADKLMSQLHEGETLTLSLGGEQSTFTRFSQSRIRQTGRVDESDVALTLMRDQRRSIGVISLSGDLDLDETSALTELEKLRNEVGNLPEDPYIVLPEGDLKSRAANPGRLLAPEDTAAALTPAMQGVDLAGIWSSGNIFRGVATSTGQRHWFETETFSLDYSLITPAEKMVKATFAGSEWDQDKYERFMADSIKKLRMMEQSPKKIEPGEYRTYIASAGVADFLNMFSWGGVSEAAIRQGESAFGKMRNEDATLSPLFSLSEDFRSGLVPRFNGNGEMAPELTELIVNGQLENTLVSSRTAKEYGVESNFATEGEGLRSPVMSGGTLDEDQILDELGTGVYLSNLHYLNWSDRIGGRITGMTRYACFWVENGEIIAPIENMRFDDSIYRFLGFNLEAVTSQVQVNPDVGTYDGRAVSAVVCPGNLLKAFALTL